MRLQEPKKISREDHHHIRTHLFAKANKLAALYKELGWENINDRYFISSDCYPCRYDDYAESRINPKTGKTLRQLEMPSKFRSEHVTGEWAPPLHFSPAGCPNLKPFYSIVECLFYDGKACYYGVHRVGECPWKVAP